MADASLLQDARDAWRDAFYFITGVRDGGYLPADIRAEVVAKHVERAKALDARVAALAATGE